MVAEKQLDQCGKADGEFLTNVGVRVVLVVPEMVVKELTVDRQRNRDYGHGLGLAEYLDEMVRFQGVLRGRSWPGGGGVGLVKSYFP